MLSFFSCVWLFATLWTIACQSPLSMGFPEQEYWSRLLFPSPGDLPNQGIEPGYTALQGIFFTLWATIIRVHWRDWCWSWNSNTLATWCRELTHLKRPWCWERLRVGGEGDDRGWDGWMASPTKGTWVSVDYGSCWWTGRHGVLQFMRSQRVRHDWVTELNWIWLYHN